MDQQLRNISFNLRHPWTNPRINVAVVNQENFYAYLSTVNMQWTPYENDLNTIVLVFPIHENIMNMGGFIETQNEIKAVKYNISDLPTALEVVGAIYTFYNDIMIEPTIPELFDRESFMEIQVPRRKRLLLRFSNSNFFKNAQFYGLIMIKPGVYFINTV